MWPSAFSRVISHSVKVPSGAIRPTPLGSGNHTLWSGPSSMKVGMAPEGMGYTTTSPDAGWSTPMASLS